MKWIKSYKLFEALNRYGYEGNIIDIDKNELQDCINKLRDFFAYLISIPGGANDIIDFTSYKSGETGEDKYAYAAQFSYQLINNNAEPYEYDNIIGILAKCLFKECNCLRLLRKDGGFDGNGYSIIFTNDVNFRTNFSKFGSKVKIPDSKYNVLIAILCYYISHLENMGDNVGIGVDFIIYGRAPIFKQLLMNYCNYLLKCGREGQDLLKKEMTMDEVYPIIYNTIVNSGSRYEILDRMKLLFPDYYKKLTGIGDEISMNTAAEMGDMGFNEGVGNKKWIKTYDIYNESIGVEIENFVKSEMSRFNDAFTKIGIHMTQYSWNSNTNYSYTIKFNFVGDGCLFKELLTNISTFEEVQNLVSVLPINQNNFSVPSIEIQIAQGLNYGYSPKSTADGWEKYNHMYKDYIYKSTNLMNIFLRALGAIFGSYSEDSKNCFMFNENGSISGLKVTLPFLRDSIKEYLSEWLKYDDIKKSDNNLYEIIYNNIVKSGKNSYRYFHFMKGSKLYDEMFKISGEIDMTGDMTDMGFAD